MNTQLKHHQWSIGLTLLAVLMLTSCGGKKSDEPASSTSENPAVVSSVKSSPTAAGSTSQKTSQPRAKAVIPPEVQQLGVKPQGETTCPSDALVKGKITKKRGNIYHLAKTPDYDNTKPDICFKDKATAEKAGFRAPK